MKSAGIYLWPLDKIRRDRERKSRRIRQVKGWLKMLLANAALLWLAGEGYLHPMIGSVMMALLSARLGTQLGKEEL